jgi:ATP-dependent Clp endopeptidase proteolytic subunit ClpP
VILRTQGNILYAIGRIWEGDGVHFLSVFNSMESQHTNIVVKLHTFGGSVFDGNLIYNAIQNSKSDIEIQILGVAASMGAVIALSRKKVFLVENGFLMVHAPSGGTYGTASDHENNAKLLRSIEKNFLKKLMAKTGKPENHVKKWLSGDNWFDAEAALDEGLISGIIEPETEIEAFDPKEVGTEETYNRFAALLLPTSETQTENENPKIENPNMKLQLIQALALVGVSAESSDTAVIEAVKNHIQQKEQKLSADLQTEKTKREDAEGKLKAQTESTVNALIAEADKTQKFSDSEKETYKNIGLTAGVESLQTVLAKLTPTQKRNPISQQFNAGKDSQEFSAERDNWDFDKWQKEDPRGWEALATSNPEKFQEVLNAKFKK